MPAIPDLVGQTFTRLTVQQQLPSNTHGKTLWLCLCACGNTTQVPTGKLRSGKTRSCGCLYRESRGLIRLTHGKSTRTGSPRNRCPEYGIWIGMKTRCHNPNSPGYYKYGGKGIVVCARWRNDFVAFYTDMGARPHRHVIDRIDPSGPYSPENCRWVDYQTSGENRSSVSWLEFNGERLTIAGWARKLKVPAGRLRYRLKQGQTVEEILFDPPASVPFR